MKKQCLKIDYEKIDFNKTATHNVWLQFGIDIDKTKSKIDVTKYYMPQEVQQELISYLEKNYKKLKAYKKTKKVFQNSITWENLGYFPSSYKKGCKE
jgi:hypothetical protein